MARLLWPRRNRFAVFPVSAGLGFIRQLGARVNIALWSMFTDSYSASILSPSPVDSTAGIDLLSMQEPIANHELFISLGTVTISIASPAVVTRSAHGLINGQMARFLTTGTLPTGIVGPTTTYFVINVTANTFQISSTLGGSAVTTSGSQTGTHTVIYKV